jgi:hypothetical protein
VFRRSPAVLPGQPSTSGRLTADGKRLYRLTGPVVLWWAWVAVAAAGLGDLVVQGRDVLSLRFAFGILIVTGVVYACARWPSVIADEAGLSVRNPVRVFDIPWAAVRGIYLADSLEVQCARPAPKKDKTVYSWALASPRRTRARAQLRGMQIEAGRRSRPSTYGRLPEPAKAMARTSTAEIMARELAELSEQANARPESADQETAVMTARWAWIPAAVVLAPAAGLLIAALAG